jgi:hypothetical protein
MGLERDILELFLRMRICAQISNRLGNGEGDVRVVLHRAMARVSDFVGAG